MRLRRVYMHLALALVKYILRTLQPFAHTCTHAKNLCLCRAERMYRGHEDDVFKSSQPNLFCNTFYWVDEPEKRWPDKIWFCPRPAKVRTPRHPALRCPALPALLC